MPRNITLTFDDGTSHVYQNAPDDVTPDQIEERATKEFSGKKISGMDGGNAPVAPKKETAPEKQPSFGERLGTEIKSIGTKAKDVMASLTRPPQAGEYGSTWHDEAKQYYARGAATGPNNLNPATGLKTAGTALAGMAEVPLAMGSGLAANAAGAVAGGTQAAFRMATSNDTPGQAIDTGMNTASKVAEAGTYQPRTDMGKVAGGLLGAPQKLAAEVGGAIGGSIGRVAGNENLGETLGSATGELAPAVSGLRKLPEAVSASLATKKQLPMGQADAAKAAIIDQGYAIMPTAGKNSAVNSGLTTVAKEPKVKNTITLKNQETTNALAKKDLGLEENQKLDEATLLGQRAPHYAKYEQLKNLDFKFKIDQKIIDRVNALGGKALNIQESFPEFRASVDTAQAQNLVTKSAPEVTPRATVELVKKLREDSRHDMSRREITSSEKDAAGAKLDIANALEDLMDRGLKERARTHGDVSPALIQELRIARREIAKSHNVQESTNLETGNVDATKLAALRAKGTPLTGGLKTIAIARRVAPDVVRNTDGVVPSPEFSIGDIGMGALGGMASHGPVGVLSGAAAAAAVRPAARALVTSRGYQNKMVKPTANTAREGLRLDSMRPETALSMGSAAPQNTPWRKQDEGSDR